MSGNNKQYFYFVQYKPDCKSAYKYKLCCSVIIVNNNNNWDKIGIIYFFIIGISNEVNYQNK